jgi:hypothetical protein
MSRQVFEAPTGAFDVDMRVRRLEERVTRLEAALDRLIHPAGEPTAAPEDHTNE